MPKHDDSLKEKVKIALTPRLWDEELNNLWHKDLPDINKSFENLRNWILNAEETR